MQQKIFSIENVIKAARDYNPKSDSELLREAYSFALEAHAQKKESARIQHLLNVALIVAELGTDDSTIASAILHDTILREGLSKNEIQEKFGEEIARIVDECCRSFTIEEKNLGKLAEELISTAMLGSAQDIRGIFIILASAVDTLNRTGLIEEKEKENYATMALGVLVPMCEKLGLSQIKWRLEDSAFKVLNPKAYSAIKALVGEKREAREKEIEKIRQEIKAILKKEKINARVFARAKHFFAINKKISSGKTFSEIMDLRGIRILCENLRQCYEILGIINSNFETVPGTFDDYIASPKANNYKSIHTVVLWQKKPVEVQIRTWEMHWQNEAGIAAHWAYKQYLPNAHFDKKLSWAMELIQWLHAEKSKKIMDALRLDFGEHKVFVFTPKKQVIILPEGSTPIDFAFAVHSDIGFKCYKAKVNGKIVPLNQELQNADLVEIITAHTMQVRRDWLGFAKSEKAKTKIRQKLGIPVAKKKKIEKSITTANSAVRIAKCCNPLPGEEIIGIRTTKRKIIAHKLECKNAKKIAKEKTLQLKWDLGAGEKFEVKIRVQAHESPSLLPELLNAISSSGATIVFTSAKTDKSKAVNALFNIKLREAKQLEKILQKIRKLPQVFEVTRE